VILAGQSVWLFRGTVRENFAQFHQFRCSPPPADGEIERLLRLCAAPFTPRTSCDQLSGGERQRIFLAVALSFAPRLLLLDEPTSALDEATAQILLGNLTAWCRAGGMTLVAVSHDAGLAQRFSDRVVRIGAEQP